MSKTMLALNAGSSSIKFGLFGMARAEPTYLFAGEVADIGAAGRRRGSKRIFWTISWIGSTRMRGAAGSPRSDIESCTADRNLLRRYG
jgi:hypothetical protein